MKAEEMFKEIGYRQIDETPTYIEYVKEVNTKIVEIVFDLEEKRIIKQDFNTLFSYYIKFEEIQAINKQIEELGWNKGSEK